MFFYSKLFSFLTIIISEITSNLKKKINSMKTKNPLTVDTIVQILNQQNYNIDQFNRIVNNPNRFSINNFNELPTNL